MFHYMNEKIGTFNVKYEIVLYTPVFNARWGGTPIFVIFFPLTFWPAAFRDGGRGGGDPPHGHFP